MASSTSGDLALAAARVNLCLGAEQRLLASNAHKRRLPVTIVTGFLGAGKTSLLQHILAHRLNLRVACAVSDLAAINVDALLVAQSAGGGNNALFELRADDGSLAAFQDAVWRVLQDDDSNLLDASSSSASLGSVDYLVMETSGTTDPTALVAAVQRKFGKMTRARLDSVVAVVDGDAVAQDASRDVAPCDVAVRQLQCADVVLLNKMDLLDAEALATARAVVTRYAPSARIYETDHCQVYLPHVLDIAPPENATTGGVSHERSVTAQWSTGLSALESGVAPASSRLRVAHDAQPTPEAVPPSSAFSSVTFERTDPVPLAALHAWIHGHLPPGTLRAKGVLYVAELPRTRFVLQLSGKRRLEVEASGPWRSTPKTQFVVIGANASNASSFERFDEAQARVSLERWLSLGLEQLDDSVRDACLARLTADERFCVLESELQAPTVVAFRLACPTSSLDAAMLRHHHHVDMNELTRRLVREVNASGDGSLLLYATQGGDNPEQDEAVTFAVASVAGEASVLSMWGELSARADGILTEVKRKLAGCLCGF